MTALELPAELFLWLDHPLSKRALPIPENPVAALKAYLEALTLAKYLIVATFTLLIYDTILTYRSEVRLIWGSRWTFARVLFTLVRYFIPCVLLLNLCFNFHPRLTAKTLAITYTQSSRCKVEIKVIAAVGIFSNSLAMCILGLRVWAIWDQKLWMLAILSVIFLSSVLSPSILVGREIQVQSYANLDCFATNPPLRLQKLVVIDNPLPGILTGCVVIYQSGLSARWVRLYICTLVYDSSLFMLTLLKAWILRRRGIRTPIMTLLTRDGAWYFLVTMVSVSLVTVGTSLPKTQVAALLSLFSIGIIAGASSRLLLRLRGFYTPTEQTTRREASRRAEDIAMRNYSSRSDGRSAPENVPEVVVCAVNADETSKVNV